MAQKYTRQLEHKTSGTQKQPSHKFLCFEKLNGQLDQKCPIITAKINKIQVRFFNSMCSAVKNVSGLNGNSAISWSHFFLHCIQQININTQSFCKDLF